MSNNILINEFESLSWWIMATRQNLFGQPTNNVILVKTKFNSIELIRL